MFERRYFSVCASILLIFVLFLAPKVSAIEVKSYLVADYQEVSTRPHTIVLFNTNVTLPWKSGKVVVSGSRDGTQPVNIAWRIEFANTKSNTARFSYDNSDKNNTCVDKDIPPLNITHIFLEGSNTITVRFDKPCFGGSNNQNIGPIYFVHFDDYEISDEPFLDLPWDYAADGERFEEVALRMSSYFDHEYPLLSTNLREPEEYSEYLLPYNSDVDFRKQYSSHDGYDWARSAGAVLDDPVLAAAPGWATYRTNKYIGNAIFIDHENGYQTRYYHMNLDNLVTRSSVKKWVDDRQQVGTVGFTGNVRPVGSKGAHIHFMVVKDKDGNGSFDDNIPDGIVDPFGWQAEGPDPWPAYTFSYNGKDRTGIKSTYLWKKSMKEGPQTIISTQTNRIINSGSNTTFDFPMQIVSHDVIFDSVARPPVTRPSIDGVIRDTFASIGSTISATMKDGFDNLITSFIKKFTLTFTFQDQDIARYKPDSLSIYSSPDGVEWKKEETTINSTKKQASVQIDHLTDFALMGEQLDSIAPVTTVDISGTQNGAYYTAPITLALHATDEPTAQSLGVLYTGYQINDEPWSTYSDELSLSEEKEYVLEYYSEDGDGNVEEVQQLSFIIDFTPPTPTAIPSLTPTPTILSEAPSSPTQTPNPTSTPTSVPIADTSTPNVIQSISPISTVSLSISLSPSISTADDQGEVKSVFAAESGNEIAPPEDNTYPSLSFRNLWIMIIVLVTAIILVWYRTTRRKEIRT